MSSGLSLRKLKNSIINLGALQALNFLLPLITVPYLIRVVGIENFGLLGFVLASMSYVAVIADYGFNLSATREIALRSKSRLNISDVTNSVIYIKLMVLMTSGPIIYVILLNSGTTHENFLIYVYTFSFIAGQVMTPAWLYQGLEKINFFVNISIVSRVTSTILIFLNVKTADDVLYVPLINSIFGWMTALILITYAYVKFEIDIEKPNINHAISQLKSGWEIFLSSVFINIYANSMTVLLGISAGNVSVGHFSAADKIIQAMKSMYQPVAQSVFPLISKMISTDLSSGIEFAKKIKKISIVANAMVMILVLIAADEIIRVLAGSEMPEAAMLLRLMSPIPMLVSISNIYGVQIMLNIGMRREYKSILMCGAIFGVVSSVFLISRYQEYGAALVVCLVEAGVAFTMYFMVERNLRKNSKS